MRHSCLSVSDMRELNKYRCIFGETVGHVLTNWTAVFFRYSTEIVKEYNIDWFQVPGTCVPLVYINAILI